MSGDNWLDGVFNRDFFDKMNLTRKPKSYTIVGFENGIEKRFEDVEPMAMLGKVHDLTEDGFYDIDIKPNF